MISRANSVVDEGEPTTLIRSADERMQDQIYQIWPYSGIASTFFVLALFDWQRSWTHAPPTPWLKSIIAATGVIVCAFKWKCVRTSVRNYRQGRDGERMVA